MLIRPVVAAALAAASWLAAAAPAGAHEEISPPTFPVGRATFLTLIAANESSSALVKIALRAPPGLAFGTTTRSPAGWTAAVSGNSITWTGGALEPGRFETYGFETEGADQPGTFTYAVTSTNANGRDDSHEVVVTAAVPGSGGPDPGTASPPATGAPATTTTTPAVDTGRSGDDSDAAGIATAALVVSVGALLAAGAALIKAGRGRTPSTGGGSRSDRQAAPDPAQDW
jgi:hypothetical protein